jgi:hypothetical protein
MQAHGSFEQHVKDMMEVLGFDQNALENKGIKEWAKFISSDMIDKRDEGFQKKLSEGYPGLTFKHRLLFHWGYDAEPWNSEIERKVKEYCEVYDRNEESNIRVFKSILMGEQKRRNGEIDNRTQNLFGFASGGKDRAFSHFFSSTAYNIHILGDYMSDNTDLDGLCPFQNLVGLIIEEINKIDPKEGKKVVWGINKVINSQSDVQQQADALMAYLKTSIPPFIRKAQNGAIYRRLEKRGFKFLPYKEEGWISRIKSIFL